MEQLFTKKEAAAYLKVSERTLDREIDRHDLKVFKVGRSVRVPESTVSKLLVEVRSDHEKIDKTIHKLLGE